MDSFWARSFKSTLLSMDIDTRIYFGLATILRTLNRQLIVEFRTRLFSLQCAYVLCYNFRLV